MSVLRKLKDMLAARKRVRGYEANREALEAQVRKHEK